MSRSLKTIARTAARNNYYVRPAVNCVFGVRWNSTESNDGGHKWSTPLAKQLAEAITVWNHVALQEKIKMLTY
jgi:hypothetical protein